MKIFFNLQSKNTSAATIIKAFRKNFRITQAALSQVTGLSVSQLSAIENQRTQPNIKQAVLISAALGIDPTQLLFPNGTHHAYAAEARRVQKKSARLLTQIAS